MERERESERSYLDKSTVAAQIERESFLPPNLRNERASPSGVKDKIMGGWTI